MIAYKGFHPGMVCIGYQFQMGLNMTEEANCRKNGFHCAEDPLDCLSYYGDADHSEYYIVNAGGDIVPFPVSWTVKMKKKQKETQDILSYHSQAAGCSDKARAKASGGRQPIEECGRTGL